MRILLINYRYFLSGGPEKYMFAVKELFENNGHEVIPFSVRSKKDMKTRYERYFAEPIGDEEKVYYKEYKKDFKTFIQILDRQFYSFDVKKKLDRLIKDTKPDICYLMHHYNKLSPSVIDACKKNKLPIVMRISDFFLACPTALMIRNKKICEDCLDKSLLSAVRHKCVKGSRLGSLIKIMAMYFHRLINIYKKINYIVSPSKFTISKLSKVFPNKKFIHIPTFINVTEDYNSEQGDYILLIGRVEEEKGIMQAVKAVKGTPYKLKIVGKSSTGYDKKIKQYISTIKNVEFLGLKYGKDLQKIYREARCIVIPSQWYENMPNVALEAMMYSKPILASDLGSLREIVKDNHNGFLFSPKNIDEFRKKIDILFSDDELCRKLGKNAYNDAIREYNPEIHYNKLIEVFNKAIAEEKLKWKH